MDPLTADQRSRLKATAHHVLDLLDAADDAVMSDWLPRLSVRWRTSVEFYVTGTSCRKALAGDPFQRSRRAIAADFEAAIFALALNCRGATP